MRELLTVNVGSSTVKLVAIREYSGRMEAVASATLPCDPSTRPAADIATEVGVAKGTVFLDFGSKEGLFLAAFQKAVASIPAWLDAPPEIVEQGFWATLDWWLERAEELVAADPVPNRVAQIGRNDTGLGLRRPIDRFMRSEDPYGTLEFV